MTEQEAAPQPLRSSFLLSRTPVTARIPRLTGVQRGQTCRDGASRNAGGGAPKPEYCMIRPVIYPALLYEKLAGAKSAG